MPLFPPHKMLANSGNREAARMNLRAMRLAPVVVLLGSLAALPAFAGDRPPCDDLQACIRAIPATAAPGEGISREEDRLAEAIYAYGGAAIPGLLPYLKDKNEEVRALASYILSSQPGLREEHLPALMESRLRGDGWIPPAIARIGTPKAIAFLVSELKKERETGTQLTSAFERLGEKAGPPLVELYRCGAQCDEALLRVCESIFGELKEKASAVIPDLKAIALDKKQALVARRAAVTTLGAMGPSAASAAPDLLKLAASEKADFGEAVVQALIGMRHPAAVTSLLNRIAKGDKLAFIDLADLGYAGKSAGPAIVKYLNDPDRTVYAARTLGYIGYAEATQPLTRALSSDDWRLVYVACESLGQMKAATAGAELERVANTHWYPPVRDAAKAALGAIAGKDTRKPHDGVPPSFHFIDYQWAGDKLCARARLEPDQRYASTAVPGGRLVGTDLGEFGGGLYFVDDATGVEHRVLADNIIGIFQVGSRLVALGGLAHMATNYGTAFEIARKHGNYSAAAWRHLPGAPRRGELQKDGRLLVFTEDGVVLLSEDGTLEMAPCRPQDAQASSH